MWVLAAKIKYNVDTYYMVSRDQGVGVGWVKYISTAKRHKTWREVMDLGYDLKMAGAVTDYFPVLVNRYGDPVSIDKTRMKIACETHAEKLGVNALDAGSSN